ncbi:MAG: glycosyltransferase family 4 protein [Acetobacteraceae bacterium]|nr:glycosyltransferase family 4 protein [Acetobacteraceae bacterium]
MKILVWQWGKRGAGPRFAVELAESLRLAAGTSVLLSLSTDAEIMAGGEAPLCELPMPTYAGLGGFARRLLTAPLAVGPLARRVRALAPDLAICAMPGPLDLLMAEALRRARVPMLVVVHDADPHPGDALPLQMLLQRRLVLRADGLIALTAHVGERLRAQRLAGIPGVRRRLFLASLPPFVFGPPPPPAGRHGGRRRLLAFGRLRPYKGLDLLADALRQFPRMDEIELRVVGHGPESDALAALRSLPNVTVENRWVAEGEVGGLIAWADALVLSHREASQSGVAAAAIAARRWIVSTRVGGLAEQLGGAPGAILCDPEPDSLADALGRLLDRPPVLPAASPAGPRAEWHGVTAGLLGELRRSFPIEEAGA